MTRTPLVAGNWKMNGRRAQAQALAGAVAKGFNGAQCDAALCVPFPYLQTVEAAIAGSSVMLGAQNLSQQADGAFTGEVSAEMLADSGCQYVIVGHSERRALYAETSALVAEKFVRAQQAGLVPILCVGETLDERNAGTTEQVVAEQLDAVVSAAGVAAFERAVVAYEPVWAIGTGLTASPEQAQAVHAFLRARLAASDAQVAAGTRILYGGSVKADNAAALFAGPDIDGGLIGGASLDADSFLAICQATTK